MLSSISFRKRPAGEAYSFARAAMTKHPRLHSLNNRNLLSYGSRGWNSQVQASAGLVSPKTPSPGWQMAPPLCVPTWPFLCAPTPLVALCARCPLLIRTAVTLNEDSRAQPHFLLITAVKVLFLNTVLFSGIRHWDFNM